MHWHARYPALCQIHNPIDTTADTESPGLLQEPLGPERFPARLHSRVTHLRSSSAPLCPPRCVASPSSFPKALCLVIISVPLRGGLGGEEVGGHRAPWGDTGPHVQGNQFPCTWGPAARPSSHARDTVFSCSCSCSMQVSFLMKSLSLPPSLSLSLSLSHTHTHSHSRNWSSMCCSRTSASRSSWASSRFISRNWSSTCCSRTVHLLPIPYHEKENI